jgi:uncharacterized protein (UPF0261 family)
MSEGGLRLDGVSALGSQAQAGGVMVGEDRVAFAVGNSVVVQHLVTRKQTVLVRGGDRGAVTALAASAWAGYVLGRVRERLRGALGAGGDGGGARCAACCWWRRRAALRS